MYCLLTAVQFTGRVYRNVHNTDCACGAAALLARNIETMLRSTTLAQHYSNIGSTSRVCWEACILPNTRHWPNAGSIFVHRLLRWPNIESALCEHSELAGCIRHEAACIGLHVGLLLQMRISHYRAMTHTCWGLSTILYTPL